MYSKSKWSEVGSGKSQKSETAEKREMAKQQFKTGDV